MIKVARYIPEINGLSLLVKLLLGLYFKGIEVPETNPS